MVPLVAATALLAVLLAQAAAAPQKAGDVFVAPCPFQPDPPPGGFMRWSSAATWGGDGVPGVGPRAGGNATIPCGKAILLDVPAVSLTVLLIQGFLKFLDSPSLPVIALNASYIIVQGQLTIGTPTAHFKSNARITLVPNPAGPIQYLFSGAAPADAANPRKLGYQVLAVVGGRVHLHGMPAGATTATFTRLAASAAPGEKQIAVRANAAGWPVGGQVVVASTDYDYTQAEVASNASGGSVVALDRPLAYMHWGGALLPDGAGGNLDQGAEVALLTRNILITAPPSNNLVGGHFMVFFTTVAQYIDGVEFTNMGQQGTLGRYPIHIHMCGNQAGGTTVTRNSVHQSYQRCVVIHGTANVTVSDNVAYDTAGHCYITEEGGETGNAFLRNLGLATRAVATLIPNESPPGPSTETDDRPATFWMSNPNNVLVGNFAGGGDDTGFWFELREAVRGISADLPGNNAVVPFNVPLGIFTDNVAHSYGTAGFRTYPHGMRPRLPSGVPASAVFARLQAFKNGWIGLFIHNSDGITATDLTFSDNPWGIYLNQDEGITVQRSRFVGLSANYGNPAQCFRTDEWGPCVPVTGCTLPVSRGTPARSSIGHHKMPSFGIVWDQGNRSESGGFPNLVKGSTFANYDPTCRPAAALGLAGAADFWNAAQRVQSLSFVNATPVYMVPRIAAWSPGMPVVDGGEISLQYALRDLDGCLVGAPGYVVARTPAMLPPAAKGCTLQAAWNAYSCPKLCYRTVAIQYNEPGFGPTMLGARKHGDFSWVEITRVEDGMTTVLDGNLNAEYVAYGGATSTSRFFFANLLTGYTYLVAFKSSGKFYPAAAAVNLKDGAGCGGIAKIRIAPPDAFHQWTFSSTDQIVFNSCGILPSGSAGWDWSAGIVPASFAQTTATKVGQHALQGGFGSGQGIFGYGNNFLVTTIPKTTASVITYYFQQAFNLTSVACYSGLDLDIIVDDGVVVYLNGDEVLRSNMPLGKIRPLTQALSHLQPIQYPNVNYTSFHVDLVGSSSSYALREGINLITVEVHAAFNYAWEMAFDMRISAIKHCDGIDNDCDGYVDNGPGNLNCGAGQGCFAGKCQPIADYVRAIPVVPAGSAGWSYYDLGGDATAAFPQWKVGQGIASWKTGTAPLGYDTYNASDIFQTPIGSIQGKFITSYFVKAFTLTATDLPMIESMMAAVRRDDGAVLYVNGQEVFRTNMPSGLITFQTVATSITWNSDLKTTFYPCDTCGPSTASLLKAGLNYIAVELHQNYLWSGDAAMDVVLSKYLFGSCQTLPGAPKACILAAPSKILLPIQVSLDVQSQSTWRYLDGGAVAPATWTTVTFDDSNWKTGSGMFGFGSNGGIQTKVSFGADDANKALTYCFRTTITAADLACFFELTASIIVNDGAVVYVNGNEVFRLNMPDTPVTSATQASFWGSWSWQDTILTPGTWVKNGANVIAVEAHLFFPKKTDFFFDMQLAGRREEYGSDALQVA
eukprot:SM000269S09915  [mRNA]  locus=s269:76387:85016:- [translate_table: standard]